MKERGKPVIVVPIHRRSRCLTRGRGCRGHRFCRATGQTADEGEDREETNGFNLFHNHIVFETTARLLAAGASGNQTCTPTNRRQRRGRPRFSTPSQIGS